MSVKYEESEEPKRPNGAVPTKLVLLSDLGSISRNTKVRFLGCVVAYDKKAGVLDLEHNFPLKNSTRAIVDVGLLLSSLNSTDTQIGEWINVMGYICINQSHQTSNDPKRCVKVQAIALWTTEAFDLAAYEKSLEDGRMDKPAS